MSSYYQLEFSVTPGCFRRNEIWLVASKAELRVILEEERTLGVDFAVYGQKMTLSVVQSGEISQIIDLHPYLSIDGLYHFVSGDGGEWTLNPEPELDSEDDDGGQFIDSQLILDENFYNKIPHLDGPLLKDGDVIKLGEDDELRYGYNDLC
jgi:hypothetical protein